jgi:segregation and condensation protein B
MAKEINLFEETLSAASDNDLAEQEEFAVVAAKTPSPEPKSAAEKATKTAEEIKKSSTKPSQPELPGFHTAFDIAQQQVQQEKFIKQHVKRIVEALLFSSNAPITFTKIHEITDTFHALKPRQLRDLISELQQEYLSQHRAFRLEEIADGYMLRTCEEYGSFIEKLHVNRRDEKLSQASMEVLAIIAYKHPITRQQIEAIRGVDSTGVVQSLIDRNLIEVTGRLDMPGRPSLLSVTKEFLEHFGLKNSQELKNLPIM